MSDNISRWELRKDGEVLGRLVAYRWDFPWLDCDFEPTGAFDVYRDLFVGDFRLLKMPDSQIGDAEWEDAYDKIIAAGIAFVPVDPAGEQLRAELIRAEGDAAEWLMPILGQ
jgi:hypothetical protein